MKYLSFTEGFLSDKKVLKLTLNPYYAVKKIPRNTKHLKKITKYHILIFFQMNNFMEDICN